MIIQALVRNRSEVRTVTAVRQRWFRMSVSGGSQDYARPRTTAFWYGAVQRRVYSSCSNNRERTQT